MQDEKKHGPTALCVFVVVAQLHWTYELCEEYPTLMKDFVKHRWFTPPGEGAAVEAATKSPQPPRQRRPTTLRRSVAETRRSTRKTIDLRHREGMKRDNSFNKGGMRETAFYSKKGAGSDAGAVGGVAIVPAPKD